MDKNTYFSIRCICGKCKTDIDIFLLGKRICFYFAGRSKVLLDIPMAESLVGFLQKQIEMLKEENQK